MIERRQHRRIVTLKNFGWLMVFLLVVFIGLSIDRSRGASEGYGRIVDGEIAANDDIRPKPQVIIEAPPVPDQNAADPLLLSAAAREQEFLSTSTTPAVTVTPIAAAQMATPVDTRGSGAVSIVGDSGGVAIVRNGEAKRPVLAGGIFKQP